MLKPLPSISDAEWQVMDVIWGAPPPVAASDVVARLAGRRTGWSPRTVKTMLNRLVNKGALAFQADGKRYLYEPAVSRDACVRAQSRSFLSRVFGGSVTPAVVHFLEHAKLTPAEVDQLRRVLEREARP